MGKLFGIRIKVKDLEYTATCMADDNLYALTHNTNLHVANINDSKEQVLQDYIDALEPYSVFKEFFISTFPIFTNFSSGGGNQILTEDELNTIKFFFPNVKIIDLGGTTAPHEFIHYKDGMLIANRTYPINDRGYLKYRIYNCNMLEGISQVSPLTNWICRFLPFVYTDQYLNAYGGHYIYVNIPIYPESILNPDNTLNLDVLLNKREKILRVSIPFTGNTLNAITLKVFDYGLDSNIQIPTSTDFLPGYVVLNNEPVVIEGGNKPYEPGGTTTPDEGNTPGTWDRIIDDIDGNHSGYNDLEAGLFRVYALSKQQLSAFANKLWNPSILEAIAQHFSDPTGIVISLLSYPFIVPHKNNEELIQFNWIPKWLDGVDVKGHRITEEYYTVDFGDINIKRYSGLFYDYQPYSSAQLYLPYVGFVNLKINEILDGDLNITYHINLLTGDFAANVKAKNLTDKVTGQNYNMLIATFTGNLSRPLPLSRQDMLEVFKSGIELAKTVATTAMGVGNGIGAVANLMDQRKMFDEVTKISTSNKSNSTKTASREIYNLLYDADPFTPPSETLMDTFKNGFSKNNNSASDVSGANAPIARSGSLSSVLGRCTEQSPFILLSYPHQNVSEKQNLMGYATNLSGTLEDFEGYTEIRDIRLAIPTATSSELSEIEKILSGGIII